VPYEHCREVPAVDCFFVLKTVPDVLCGPQPYQDCQDVVKEVPYLAPEETCEQVPYETCDTVEEQVLSTATALHCTVASRCRWRSAPAWT
jgi:hypothetical protein